ncbi:MAG: hypothetical protein V2I57_13120 [Xanthomonadales bacterium]|jgi:hypothetical protein|nr:hypothetical protein [Xanthomonadales bacterium]
MPRSSKPLLVLALSFAVALPTAAWAGENFTTVNKTVRIDDGETVGNVKTVNGSVRIGAGSVAESVQSVNGAIDIEKDAKVEEDVTAVNGAIELDRGVDVGGNVETVNGGIEIQAASVAGDVETVNGGIALLDGTVVEGSVLVKKPWGWSSDNRKPVKVEIGRDVQVKGDLIFEQPVRLKIHESASFDEMIGDDIEVVEG